MGIFNLQKVIKAFQAGNLDKALEGYKLNDLVFMRNELKKYSEKNKMVEDLSGLFDNLDERISSLQD